ncbi:hypothetical protein SELMODRAFT_119116 [Selaginella moellendorffii]|uniref:Uncharacterized protein DFL1L4B-2 n=1 Tax=Selaginella moellendorffii TaxID=88036 RepID=D8SKM8_SELML|nr:hypothetical protein SELMODRAFT_119116 [Selaginella moellendorffii]
MENEQLLLEKLESSSWSPGEAQDKVLTEILGKNATTVYFNRHGLRAATKEVFRQRAPVIEYEDIKDEINRIADGEASTLLCANPITDMFTSSGTSGGAHKLFPKAEGHYAVSNYFFDLATALLNRYSDLPGLRTGKALYFLYVRSGRKTPGGLPAYPALTGYYNSLEFRNRPFDPSNDYTSPMEVILCTDSVQASYCHLLCGLIHARDVTKLGCFFASALVRSIRCLEAWWQELSRDIRTGTLSERVVDPACREAVEKILRPDPELANVIDEACSSGSLKGIVRKLWPSAKAIDTVVTGAMEQYVGEVDYLTGGLPIASMIYASSESFFGVNLKPLCEPSQISYMFLPETSYYEFLPVARSEEKVSRKEPVELVDVEQGHEYELVITTNAGLYRYRMGDVLRVEGFHNKAPLFSFVCRRNVLLSIDSDKTDEKELQTAVMNAFAALRNGVTSKEGEAIRLTDYTSYADLSSNPPHYVIYWELSSELHLEPEKAGECCYKMEESLSVVYHRGRMERSIGALELRLVTPGTFNRIADDAASRGGSVAQFKLPRCVKKNATRMLEIVESGVYQQYFSPRAPKY